MTTPQELKQTISYGLLSFPLIDFDADLRFAPKPCVERLQWLMHYGATALFTAGGTGEFFSLEPQKYSEVVRTAVQTCRGRMPIIAGAGGRRRDAGDQVRTGSGVSCPPASV
ncbi:MAG: dihydrodipicolinate synthetase [Variovorax sp.]|nr:dihydrodipicolinate synthetase [Variovorax sp.]